MGDADVGFRTLYGKENNVESRVRLLNSIASNQMINGQDSNKILQRFEQAQEVADLDRLLDLTTVDTGEEFDPIPFSDSMALNLVNYSDYLLAKHILETPDDK